MNNEELDAHWWGFTLQRVYSYYSVYQKPNISQRMNLLQCLLITLNLFCLDSLRASSDSRQSRSMRSCDWIHFKQAESEIQRSASQQLHLFIFMPDASQDKAKKRSTNWARSVHTCIQLNVPTLGAAQLNQFWVSRLCFWAHPFSRHTSLSSSLFQSINYVKLMWLILGCD